jgi:hypothetical protein
MISFSFLNAYASNSSSTTPELTADTFVGRKIHPSTATPTTTLSFDEVLSKEYRRFFQVTLAGKPAVSKLNDKCANLWRRSGVTIPAKVLSVKMNMWIWNRRLYTMIQFARTESNG